MDPPENPSPAKREIQIQGPRPTPLRVSKQSHSIRKPPIAPRFPPPHAPPQHVAAPPPGNQPVIIYSVSPKPIHVDASNFMSIVQQLTGRETAAARETPAPADEELYFPNSGDAPVTPSERLAALERTSPSERDRRRSDLGDDFVLDMDLGLMPGILSPAPANLPTIAPGMFSPAPAPEGQSFFGGNDWMMSPFMNNNGGYSFLPSPSGFFFSGGGSAAIVSPTLSPGGEVFNLFDNF